MQPSGTPGSDVLQAWESSFLSELPHQVRDAMLRDVFVVTVPAGQPIYQPFETPRLLIIASGLARVKMVSREGREATLRYAGGGQVVGLPNAVKLVLAKLCRCSGSAARAERFGPLSADAVKPRLCDAHGVAQGAARVGTHCATQPTVPLTPR